MLKIRSKCFSVNMDRPEDIVVVKAFDIPSAWAQMVEAVQKFGITQRVQDPDYDIDAKTVYNLVLTIAHPESRPIAEPRAGCDEKFIQDYFLKYFYMPDLGGELEHSYGDRLQKPFNQFERAAQMLVECPHTRRAVILIPRPEDMDSKYPPCIRELNFTRPAPNYDKLLTTVFIRSWDIYGASNADMGSFQLAAEHVANLIGIPTGQMTVLATNAHIYRKGLRLIEIAKEHEKRKRPWQK